ncbi:chymotrypsin-2-like [Tetranychus urticae]|uniref:Peptidase S1 domain-containing protein n=1 Tax=Tetranychus urticae TaxID=32264 RepID=T1JRG5_TETUR|nr:chymotrypsin-2-like [Tetranychus urticae]
MLNSAILMMFLYSNFVSSTDVEDSTEFQEKIYKGKDVLRKGVYPYFCSIQIPNDRYPYIHYCGGVLVERNVMLTAAHCLTNTSLISKLRILPNYRNRRVIQKSDPIIKVKNYVIHPDFLKQRPYSMHDIAVVLLDKPDTRPKATLQLAFRRLPVNTKVKLIGFGIEIRDYLSDALLEATVTIKDDKKCLDEKTGFEYAPIYNFCTQNNVGAGGCYGDAGGPAIWQDARTNISYLYGVLSSEQSPCNKFHTDVFVNVFAHLKFINDAYLQFSREQFGCPKTRKAEITEYDY